MSGLEHQGSGWSGDLPHKPPFKGKWKHLLLGSSSEGRVARPAELGSGLWGRGERHKEKVLVRRGYLADMGTSEASCEVKPDLSELLDTGHLWS